MGRILLMVSTGFAGLLVVCCLLGVFVGAPRLQDELQEDIQGAVATEVGRQIPSIPGVGAEPGTYVITQESLESAIRENADADSEDDGNWQVRITPESVAFGVVSRGRDATYSGVPAVENGRFVMRDMDSNNRFFEFILSPDDLGEAISDAVNTYLDENGLRLESLELQDGQMVLDVVARD